MSERKTKTVTTPSGVAVELKEYISAGEFLDLNEESEKQGLTKTQLALRTVQLAVASINGSAEDIPTKLRELPLADYTFLNKAVKPLLDGNFTEAKTQA